MAPHLTPKEQGMAIAAAGQARSTKQIFDIIRKKREKDNIEMVHITNVRLFLRGVTHKRGAKETRGRKCIYSRRKVLSMNAARGKFIKKTTKDACRITWDLIAAKGRAPKANRTTVARAFAREGIPVRLRRSREKPQRTKEQEKERENRCWKMMRWPLERFTDVIDFIMDNKRWQIPTTPEARVFLQKQKMVVQLRTPQGGLEEHFTKPGTKTHRKNLGGYVDVCAGISNGRIMLWEYYSKWNGEVAANMYKGPIMQALKKAPW